MSGNLKNIGKLLDGIGIFEDVDVPCGLVDDIIPNLKIDVIC